MSSPLSPPGASARAARRRDFGTLTERMSGPRSLSLSVVVLAVVVALSVGHLCMPGQALAQKLKPEGDIVEAIVVGLRPGPDGETQAVVLESKATPPRQLEIWIGPSEALAIQLRLVGRRYPRPLTHDLLQTVLDKTDASVVRVEIHSLRASTFIGRIRLQHAGKTHVLDARASDSIAVALGAEAPIFVSRPVFERAGRVAGTPAPLRPSPPPSTKL